MNKILENDDIKTIIDKYKLIVQARGIFYPDSSLPLVCENVYFDNMLTFYSPNDKSFHSAYQELFSAIRPEKYEYGIWGYTQDDNFSNALISDNPKSLLHTSDFYTHHRRSKELMLYENSKGEMIYICYDYKNINTFVQAMTIVDQKRFFDTYKSLYCVSVFGMNVDKKFIVYHLTRDGEPFTLAKLTRIAEDSLHSRQQ